MNYEPEVGSTGKVSLSPAQKLSLAIQEYLDSCEQEEPGGEGGGVLTGWYVVMEEQNPVKGTSSYTRATKDLQPLSTTMGLITYSDEYYRARIRHN